MQRRGSRAAATSKMECFVTIVNGWKLLTIITKYSILDVAAALDLRLRVAKNPPVLRFNLCVMLKDYSHIRMDI